MGSWVQGEGIKIENGDDIIFKYLTGNKFALIIICMIHMCNKMKTKLVACNNTSCGWFYGKVAAKTNGNYVFSSLNISGVRKCKYSCTYKHQRYLYLLIF